MKEICDKIFKGIKKSSDQIWLAEDRVDEVGISFPQDGHSSCFQIEDSSFWFRHRNSIILDTYLRFQSREEPRAFIDLGGGNGFVTKAFQDQKVDAILVEPGRAGAQNAVSRGVKNVICSVWEDLDAKIGNFDVGLFDVVEHIETPEILLSEIAKTIDSKSYVYITVPAHQQLWSFEDIEAGHFRRYSRSQLKQSLSKSGFEVVYISEFFFFLPIPIFLFRRIPFLLNKRKNGESSGVNSHEKRSFLLEAVLRFERSILKFFNIPFGGSIICVAKKIVSPV